MDFSYGCQRRLAIHYGFGMKNDQFVWHIIDLIMSQ